MSPGRLVAAAWFADSSDWPTIAEEKTGKLPGNGNKAGSLSRAPSPFAARQ